MNGIARHGTRVLTIIASVTLVLAGCGSSGGSGGTSPTPTPNSPATTASSPAATGTPVTVTEKDFSISLDRKDFPAGTYTFKVTNTGATSHNLTINGPGVSAQATPTLPPGQSAELTVSLQAGTYELFCSVDGHKDLGMDLSVTAT